MDLEEISKRIDVGDDPDGIRVALGDKITECLVARGDDLMPWERVNFGLAIDLLNSPWLRMTWAHVDFVCTVSDEKVRNRPVPESQTVPSLRELHVKLAEELAIIHDRRLASDRPKTNVAPC